jgi:Flp pilus assembly pilin Flp
MGLKRAEQLAGSSRSQGASGGRGPIVRGPLARFLRDTSSSATIEYGFIVAGIALAIVLVLEEIGADRRTAARALFRFRIQ